MPIFSLGFFYGNRRSSFSILTGYRLNSISSIVDLPLFFYTFSGITENYKKNRFEASFIFEIFLLLLTLCFMRCMPKTEFFSLWLPTFNFLINFFLVSCLKQAGHSWSYTYTFCQIFLQFLPHLNATVQAFASKLLLRFCFFTPRLKEK